MRILLSAGAAALSLWAMTAQAQTTTQQTTAGTPIIVAPPVGTLSTTHIEKTVSPDGTVTRTDGTTYRNTDGVANDTVTRTTTAPPPAVTTSHTDYSTTTTITK